MKLIAIDSSGLAASVAVMEEDSLIAEYTVQYKKTHSQTLLPMLDEVSRMIELDLKEVGAIAVTAGPGSFTGLRIGSATAKGLGLALDIPIVPVPTVEALAYNLYGCSALTCPIMDARRGQVYTGIYRFVRKDRLEEEELALGQAYRMECLAGQCAVRIEEITAQLNELGKKLNQEAIFVGDGIPVFRDKLKELMEIPYSFAPANRSRQSASALGALAQVYYHEGRAVPAAEHVPDYLRLSQAERERREALEAQGGCPEGTGAEVIQ